MADERTIQWEGQSGRSYKHWIYTIGTSFQDKGGNYIYAKETKPKHWVPVYIGEGNLADRSDLDDHHKAGCIRRNGATHIHAHLNSDEQDRLAEERDLVERLKPVCNG